MRRATCSLVAVLATMLTATAGPLVNGDFQTGTLAGWTVFTTANGSNGAGRPSVVLFDTNNSGVPSLSASFQAGQVSFTPGSFQGGGLFQSVVLGSGNLTITADIAARGGGANNASGGLFELLFDGVVVDSHNFGSIPANTNRFDTLSATLPFVTAGSHEIRIRVTRPFLNTATTPTQYLDNVVLRGTAVPEPLSLFVFGGVLAAGGLAVRRRRTATA